MVLKKIPGTGRGEEKVITSEGITIFAENILQNEPFHLNSPGPELLGFPYKWLAFSFQCVVHKF